MQENYNFDNIKVGDYLYHYVYLQNKNIVRKTKYIVTKLIDNKKFCKDHPEGVVIYAQEIIKGHEEYYKVIQQNSEPVAIYNNSSRMPGRSATLFSKMPNIKLTQIWLMEENDYYAEQMIMYDLVQLLEKAEDEVNKRKKILEIYTKTMIKKYSNIGENKNE